MGGNRPKLCAGQECSLSAEIVAKIKNARAAIWAHVSYDSCQAHPSSRDARQRRDNQWR